MPRSEQPSASSVRPVLVLVGICVVAGLLLGLVNKQTAPLIAQNEEARAQQTYEALMPDAKEFEPVECSAEGCTASLRALDDAGAELGYIIVAEAKGYGGPVPVAVSFDAQGVVGSVMVMSNDETPGLGTRATTDEYLSQYVGRPAQPVDASQIDFVSGATITSTAVHNAFNLATQIYEEVS